MWNRDRFREEEARRLAERRRTRHHILPLCAAIVAPALLVASCGLSGDLARGTTGTAGNGPGDTMSDANMSARVAYVDLSMNLSDLRAQVDAWAGGSERGQNIAKEKVERIEALIEAHTWPDHMQATITTLHERLHAIGNALEAGDLAGTQTAVSELPTHDLTHGFYDEVLPGMHAMGDHTTIHAGYHDLSMNLSDLRAQVDAWAGGSERGQNIAKEKVGRMEAIIAQVSWPAEMKGAVDTLAAKLPAIRQALEAGDLAATQAAASELPTHDLTHAFYDQWLPTQANAGGHLSIHTAYMDLSMNLSDLRTQVDAWAGGSERGLNIAKEKVERMEALIEAHSWPSGLQAEIDALHSKLHPVEQALAAGDLAATQAAISELPTHDLTHAFYDRWLPTVGQ